MGALSNYIGSWYCKAQKSEIISPFLNQKARKGEIISDFLFFSKNILVTFVSIKPFSDEQNYHRPQV
jgi:hypothetical protein